MKQELMEIVLLNIKKMISDNPNDGDLGKKIRAYFNNLPNQSENIKEKITFDDSHNNGY